MPNLFQLIYASAATEPMTREDLLGLLAQAREKNERLGITGVLLYRDDAFVQVLEGERDTVLALYETIRQDPRHHEVQTLGQRDVQRREFKDWAMGFDDLSTEGDGSVPLKNMPSYTRFLDDNLTVQQHKRLIFDYSLAYEALLAFKAGQLG